MESQQLLAPRRYHPVAAVSQQLLTKMPQPAATTEAAARHELREHRRSMSQASVLTETRGPEICEDAWRQKATRIASWITIQTSVA